MSAYDVNSVLAMPSTSFSLSSPRYANAGSETACASAPHQELCSVYPECEMERSVFAQPASNAPLRINKRKVNCFIFQFSLTVVLYLTPSGSGTATGTVVPSEPAVRRAESTATNAVNGDINP